MKKVLFNFSIAFLAFLFGIIVQNLAKPELNPPAPITLAEQNIKIEISKIQIPELPLFEKQPDLSEIEEEGGGWYQVDDFKGMREVWTMLLTRDYENEKNGKLNWLAMILTDKEDDDFHSISIKTNNNRLSFKTNKVKNIEYKFDGVFFKGKKVGKDGEKVLRGTLRKFVKGKQVAAIKADFKYYEPRCWH